MKLLISILIVLVISLNIQSQNLPNYDLESWANDGTFNNPLNWGTSNFSIFSIVSFNTVTKETVNPYSGTTCAKLKTITQLVGDETVKVAGLITLGLFEINIATRKAIVKGGVPMTSKPTIFSGYYKYTSPGVDKCIMSIYFTKFNTNTNVSDTIGIGLFSSGETTEWSQFEAPIEYTSNETPDSMNIVILSSDTTLFIEGSTLYIDKLFIDATVSTNDISFEKKYTVYPNPSSDYLHLEITKKSKAEYSIINIAGLTMKHNIVNNEKEIIDISDFPSGIYFLELNIDNKKYSETIVIQ